MSHLVVRDLTDWAAAEAGAAPAEVERALPLLRTLAPALSLAAWCDYLRHLRLEEGGGLLVVQNAAGTLLGLAVYRQRLDLAEGLCLDSEPILVFDLLGARSVAASLAEGLERRARELGCRALHASLPADAEQPLRRAFAGQGHRLEAARLCKRVT